MQMSYNKSLCTFEEQQKSQDDWSMASKMESGSRDEIRKKGNRSCGALENMG